MRVLLVMLMILVHLFSTLAFANKSFMDDYFRSISEFSNCGGEECEYMEEHSHDHHIYCVDEEVEYFALSESEPEPEESEWNGDFQAKIQSVQQPEIVITSNKDPPKITANKTFSFADMVGIVLMLN